MGSKERKRQQRQAYHRDWEEVKHNHGGLPIRKKHQRALGVKG